MKDNANKRKRLTIIVLLVTLLTGVISGWFYLRYVSTHISTDDAFVEGEIYTVAPRVSGTVLRVYVKDNQYVRKGQLLIQIDPEVYEKALREAEASLRAEQSKYKELKEALRVQRQGVRAAEAALQEVIRQTEVLEAAKVAAEASAEAAEAELIKAEADYLRADNLYKKEVIPKDRFERAEVVYKTAMANLKAKRAELKKAEQALLAHEATIKKAEAALQTEKDRLNRLRAALKAQAGRVSAREAVVERARLLLSYTQITAPSDGYVTKKSVDAGELVREGQPLMAIVPLEGVYVVANYKETKVRKIRPGMKVKIKVDAYPDMVLWGGVESIMAGTGAVFSLFPPENATGNYVKVVQRIPVKIVLDRGQLDPDHPLRLGMSVVPTVYVR